MKIIKRKFKPISILERETELTFEEIRKGTPFTPKLYRSKLTYALDLSWNTTSSFTRISLPLIIPLALLKVYCIDPPRRDSETGWYVARYWNATLREN